MKASSRSKSVFVPYRVGSNPKRGNATAQASHCKLTAAGALRSTTISRSRRHENISRQKAACIYFFMALCTYRDAAQRYLHLIPLYPNARQNMAQPQQPATASLVGLVRIRPAVPKAPAASPLAAPASGTFTSCVDLISSRSFTVAVAVCFAPCRKAPADSPQAIDRPRQEIPGGGSQGVFCRTAQVQHFHGVWRARDDPRRPRYGGELWCRDSPLGKVSATRQGTLPRSPIWMDFGLACRPPEHCH
jgi:hypothetical protein